MEAGARVKIGCGGSPRSHIPRPASAAADGAHNVLPHGYCTQLLHWG